MHDDFFEPLALGTFDRGSLRVQWTNEQRDTTTALERLIARAWRIKSRQVRAEGGSLFAGPLCRLVSHAVEDAMLHLTLGPTNYRDLVGTNLCHPELWPSLGPRFFSNALAVHATIATVDGYLLVFQRSRLVGEHAGHYDVCGGHIDPALDLREGIPDPFATVLRELQEETGIPPGRVTRVTCRGLVRSRETYKPDLIFTLETSLPSRDVIAAPLDAEHTRQILLPNRREEIAQFLDEHQDDLAPAGRACLELHQ
ncbi:MAG: NUDIX domain-containing protein [Chloroflexi bacterium]|nr:NUDIX domain-containing protein [Chloroflexota bacterium]